MMLQLAAADILLAVFIYAMGNMSFGKGFFPFFGLLTLVFSTFLNLYLTSISQPKITWKGLFISFGFSILVMASQIKLLSQSNSYDGGGTMVFLVGGIILSLFLAVIGAIIYSFRP